MLEIFNNLSPFFENNYRRIAVREYGRILQKSPPTASKILQHLEKEGLLLREEERNYHFYVANKENISFVRLQQIYYQEKLKPLTEYIVYELVNPIIILFGSLAQGEVNERSDIDIAIFTSSKKKIDCKKFEDKMKREIQLFIFKDRLSLRKNEELLNNILNGTLLEGRW